LELKKQATRNTSWVQARKGSTKAGSLEPREWEGQIFKTEKFKIITPLA